MYSKKTSLYKSGCIFFFIIFPFIYPLGLASFAITKTMMVGWELIAMISLIMMCRKGYKSSRFIRAVAYYQFMMLAITSMS